MKENGPQERNYTVIEAKRKLLDLRLSELVRSGSLIRMLIHRDFVTVYKQTILGPLWFIVQPLLTTVMYIFVFGRIAGLGTNGTPQSLFYFSGTILWTFFATCLQKTSDVFITNAGLFGKVYFPRLAVPISYVCTALITLGIQFAIFLVLGVYYAIKGVLIPVNLYVLLAPVIVVQVAVLGTGIGLIISALTTKYRDLRTLVSFGLTLWMYITPVVYPVSSVPEHFGFIYEINPMAPVMELFRYGLLGSGQPQMRSWLISLASTFVIFFVSLILFNRNERTFVDVI